MKYLAAIALAALLAGCGTPGAPSSLEGWVNIQRPYDHQWMHCYEWDRSRTCDWDHPWH